VDPNRPHAFKRLSDTWLGGGVPPVGSMGSRLGTSASIVGAAYQFTSQRCAVPGCGRPRDALIHAPEE